mmetsp:Transcript_25848/g.36446  ORF Transcript_25848/g.36446 Transcript_25848/m.36446 type:complete len:80 (-) Transcript_25848:65-304(-)
MIVWKIMMPVVTFEEGMSSKILSTMEPTGMNEPLLSLPKHSSPDITENISNSKGIYRDETHSIEKGGKHRSHNKSSSTF